MKELNEAALKKKRALTKDEQGWIWNKRFAIGPEMEDDQLTGGPFPCRDRHKEGR